MRIALSVFDDAYDRHPKRRVASWRGLCESLQSFKVYDVEGDKRRIKAWSPTIYKDGTTRGKEHVNALTCLVLDYDDGTPMHQARDVWGEFNHIVHSSWSHQPHHHRFRVVIPFQTVVPSLLWGRVWQWAAERAGGTIDEACKDPSRLYFTPAIREKDWPVDGYIWERPEKWLALNAEELPMTPHEKRLDRLSRATQKNTKVQGFRYKSKGFDVIRQMQANLKENPQVRERVGITMGGKLTGGCMRFIECPDCQRPSVWYPVVPTGGVQAQCNHVNSCGWHGWIDQLMKHRGLL